LVEQHFEQAPTLPLKTEDDYSKTPNAIDTLVKERNELLAALLEISQVACSLSPEQQIANAALAKVGVPSGKG